jgi:hypothetical protein
MSCYNNLNSINGSQLPSECITKYSRAPTAGYPTMPEKVLGNLTPTNEFLTIYNENKKSCLPLDTNYYMRSFYHFDNLCVRPEQTADIAFSRQGVATRNLKCLKRGGCRCRQNGNKQIIKQ